MLVVRFDNIMVDGKKIDANQPRFARNSEGNEKVDSLNRSIKEKKGRVSFQKGGTGGSGAAKETTRGQKSYAAIMVEGGKGSSSEVNLVLCYSSDLEDTKRWSKACIGEVLFLGESYNLQTHLEIEGFFAVNIIPLSEKLCILEEMEEGVILELMSEGNTWWKQWIKNIKPRYKGAVDSERVT